MFRYRFPILIGKILMYTKIFNFSYARTIIIITDIDDYWYSSKESYLNVQSICLKTLFAIIWTFSRRMTGMSVNYASLIDISRKLSRKGSLIRASILSVIFGKMCRRADNNLVAQRQRMRKSNAISGAIAQSKYAGCAYIWIYRALRLPGCIRSRLWSAAWLYQSIAN